MAWAMFEFDDFHVSVDDSTGAAAPILNGVQLVVHQARLVVHQAWQS